MKYIDITLSYQKYTLEKKELLINSTVIILTILLFSFSVFFIFSSASMNSLSIKNTKKHQILFYTTRLQVIKNEVNKKKLELSVVEKTTMVSPNYAKLSKMTEVLNNTSAYNLTDILNLIESHAKNISIEKFSYSQEKINLILSYSEEKNLMDFINKLQPYFSDIFILENANNSVKLEISLIEGGTK